MADQMSPLGHSLAEELCLDARAGTRIDPHVCQIFNEQRGPTT
jgi:hypothetical protein